MSHHVRLKINNIYIDFTLTIFVYDILKHYHYIGI